MLLYYHKKCNVNFVVLDARECKIAQRHTHNQSAYCIHLRNVRSAFFVIKPEIIAFFDGIVKHKILITNDTNNKHFEIMKHIII